MEWTAFLFSKQFEEYIDQIMTRLIKMFRTNIVLCPEYLYSFSIRSPLSMYGNCNHSVERLLELLLGILKPSNMLCIIESHSNHILYRTHNPFK